jgi:hypothetical protein
MSRTLTLTATAPASAAPSKEAKPPLIDARLIDALFARGVRAVPSAHAGEFLYTSDASSSLIIIATAVRFANDGAVDKAFTRGDWSFSDNFDASSSQFFVAVENLTFGPAKTFIESRETLAFITDRVHWPRERVLASLPQFAKGVDRLASLEAALEAHPEGRALQDTPDSRWARMSFIEALSHRHLADVHAAVLKFGRTKGIGLEDPVFAAAFERMPALTDLYDGAAVIDDDYFDERLKLLAHVPHAHPRFSKLAFGRLAWFPLISESWDRLSAWTVFFARRLQLARQPDLLALPFLMLNRLEEHSFHCETSDKDNLWAVETPVPQGAESPLDVLLPSYGNDAAAEAFWARLRSEAPSRKLGQANALVARSLLLSSATDAPLLLEGEAEAAAELEDAGWVEWVDRCLPGEGSLLRPPRLPAALIAHVRVTPLRPWLEALSAGLAARAALSA